MKEQKKYWNEFIIDWDESVYNSNSEGMILREKIATYFRGVLVTRMNFAIESLKEFIKNKKVIELGCGTGRFSKSLYDLGAHSVEGTDISDLAIKKANELFRKDLIPDEKFKFISTDLNSYELNTDSNSVIVGLGILQYLSDEEIINFFKNKKNNNVFFEFHEDKTTLLEIIHTIYRKINPSLPFYRIMKRSHIKYLFESSGFDSKFYYYRYKGVSFFTNIKLNNANWEAL